jgi:hypothetical protein
VLARTTKSLVVVCQAGPGNFYYRGVRLSDGASIELDGAVRSSGGFDVTNPADGTRYQVMKPSEPSSRPAPSSTSQRCQPAAGIGTRWHDTPTSKPPASQPNSTSKGTVIRGR